MRGFKFTASAVVLVSGTIAAPIGAARISPMVVAVSPSGPNSTTRLELTNPDERSFPVEVRMYRGEISELGQLKLIEADDDFIVFPTQMVVPAKSQQAIRVQYVGRPELAQSEIYYAAVRQVPVAVADQQSRVQVLVNFNVLVNVVPSGSRADPRLEVISAKSVDATPGLDVRVRNLGTRFMTAGTVPWQVAGTTVDGERLNLRLSAEEMAKAIGVGVVAPGKSRIFFVPTKKLMRTNSVNVALGK